MINDHDHYDYSFAKSNRRMINYRPILVWMNFQSKIEDRTYETYTRTKVNCRGALLFNQIKEFLQRVLYVNWRISSSRASHGFSSIFPPLNLSPSSARSSIKHHVSHVLVHQSSFQKNPTCRGFTAPIKTSTFEISLCVSRRCSPLP